MKKWKISSEIVYLIGTVILALATAMLTAADFGLSMVVAPAYIVSLKFDFLTFGQAEYIVQGLLFVVFCMVVIVLYYNISSIYLQDVFYILFVFLDFFMRFHFIFD